jgi:hypothetical protein
VSRRQGQRVVPLAALAAFGAAPGAIVLSLVVPDVPVFPPMAPDCDGVVVSVVLAVEDDFVSVEPVVSSRLWQAVKDAAAITAMVPSWAILIRFMRKFPRRKTKGGCRCDTACRVPCALQQRPRSASGF